jgi:hypothetical protein
VTVGLVDYLSPPEVLMESTATGVSLTHIKSAESHDVIFDVTKLIAPKENLEHGFAAIELKETIECGVPVKIGYIHNEGLHFETDCLLSPGNRIQLNHAWTQSKVVPSKQMFVQKTSSKNLFYHFKRSIDAEFLFVDEFLPPEDMEHERIDEKKQEREDAIRYHKKQLNSWVNDNLSRSMEKKAKVLVVDRDFHFYNNQPRTDKFSYTIRPIPYLDDIRQELERMEPQVIAFALEEQEGERQPKNNEACLLELLRYLKSNPQDDAPFIVVFNCKTPSKNIQEQSGYTNIMTTKNELTVDIMLKMAEVFEKKLASKKMIQKDQIKKVFLKKTNNASLAEIILPITVIKISETDMIFQSEQELQIGVNIHLTKPVNMCVHILPPKAQVKGFEYYGLIHSLGEADKKELRRFVNSVFFRDHDAQVNTELEEFKKLNDSKLQQKTELEKIENEKKADEAKASEPAPEAQGQTNVPSIPET